MKWPDRIPREMERWTGTRREKELEGPGVRLEWCEGLKMIFFFLKKDQNCLLIYTFVIITLLNLRPCAGFDTNYDI